jgi:predicted Zn-dependent peptidase
VPAAGPAVDLVHVPLDSGVELAVDRIPRRQTVALHFRILTGMADESDALSGISEIVESTLSKGTQAYDGRGLADAFDRYGIQWTSLTGRQSTLVRVLCLPEYAPAAVELVAEMVCRPAFPADAVGVQVDLAQQALKHLEDEPQELMRVTMNRLVLGPVLGRHIGGTPESLARMTPAAVREHWRQFFHRGRLQVAAAGPVDVDAFAAVVDKSFRGLGSAERAGREDAAFDWTPGRVHREKELEQQHIALALRGMPRQDPDFAVEQVLVGVLSGGMSGRLFTEVREKQGLVYWVGAWHEQPRGKGVIHIGASTTPQRCHQTFETLLRELRRLGKDLTETEVTRARDSLIAQSETEDDMTRARAAGLSDDLFHFGRPIGRPAKLDALRAVTLDRVVAYARRLPVEELCVGTLGPRSLA